jgi:hypothetical protein
MIENTVQVEAISGALALDSEHGSSSATTATGATTSGAGHSGHTTQSTQDGSTGAQTTTGEARPNAPVWSLGGRGNYWSDYRGYDADGDGVGDRPYRPEPPFAGALDEHPTLRFFQFTLAQQAIDTASDMFPVYRYDPVIEDAGPLMDPPGPALVREHGLNTGLIITSVMLLALAAAVLQLVFDIDPVRAILGAGRRIRGNMNRGAA